MKLANYRLRYEQGVEVVGLGYNWDLHNFATVREVRYDPGIAEAVVSWTADSRENAWGDPANCALGCSLIFEGVRRWEVQHGTGPDREILSEISSIPQHPDDWDDADHFDMWISFEDGTMIKLAAESSTLIAIKEPN